MCRVESLENEVGSEQRHETDGTRLGLGSEPIPDLGGGDGIGGRSLRLHKNTF
jgi:hypothetical protein